MRDRYTCFSPVLIRAFQRLHRVPELNHGRISISLSLSLFLSLRADNVDCSLQQPVGYYGIQMFNDHASGICRRTSPLHHTCAPAAWAHQHVPLTVAFVTHTRCISMFATMKDRYTCFSPVLIRAFHCRSTTGHSPIQLVLLLRPLRAAFLLLPSPLQTSLTRRPNSMSTCPTRWQTIIPGAGAAIFGWAHLCAPNAPSLPRLFKLLILFARQFWHAKKTVNFF